MNEENLSNIIVVKRDGKKVDFNKAKIAVAIKKGFDSVKLENGENKYTEKDKYLYYVACTRAQHNLIIYNNKW